MKISFLYPFIVFLFVFFLSGAEAADQKTPLSLSDAIRIALQNNLDIKIEQENVNIRDAAVQIASHQSDPTFRFNANLKQSIQASTSFAETGLTGTNLFEQKDVQLGMGWKTPLRWGGSTDLTLTQQKTNATFQRTNPTYQTHLAIKWTQPLLQGFGEEINVGPLVIAVRETEISLLTFRARVMDIGFKIISLYWELIFQIENLLVQKNSLQLAQQLLALNQTKVTLGLLAPIEILVAESSVASREEAVIVSEKSVRDVEDQLGNLIGLSERILPKDRPISEAIHLDPNDLLKSALKSRPEIEAAEHGIKNSTVLVEISENKLRPSLDFVGLVGPSGLGGQFADSLDQLVSGDFYRWEAGFLFSVPIGNKVAASTLWKEKVLRERSRIEKKKLISQIELEVREGERRVTSDFERIKATGRALKLSKKQLSAGAERFHLGLLSSHDLLEFQNDVTIAEGHALRAIIDYNKSLANIYRVTGTLIEKYGIEKDPLPEQTG